MSETESIVEIIEEFGKVRGDLAEPLARAQMEQRIEAVFTERLRVVRLLRQSPMDDDQYDRHQALIRGIVGPHQEQYNNDPEFHALVRTIADLIPPVMETMRGTTWKETLQDILGSGPIPPLQAVVKCNVQAPVSEEIVRCEWPDGHDGPHYGHMQNVEYQWERKCEERSSSGLLCELLPGHAGRHCASGPGLSDIEWAQ